MCKEAIKLDFEKYPDMNIEVGTIIKSKNLFDSFICAKTTAGRWIEPKELAEPAVFLSSSASDAVKGHILYVDGAILAYIGKQPN